MQRLLLQLCWQKNENAVNAEKNALCVEQAQRFPLLLAQALRQPSFQALRQPSFQALRERERVVLWSGGFFGAGRLVR
jgi:hypothetical protein